MSRGTWDVYIKSGGNWVSDSTIYRPNESMNLPKLSTQSKAILADGSNAYVTPSTKYRDEPLVFTWYWDDGTTKTKIEGYIDAQKDVKIIDHNAVEYVGRFLSINANWIAGQDSNKYDIRATFERMPSLA